MRSQLLLIVMVSLALAQVAVIDSHASGQAGPSPCFNSDESDYVTDIDQDVNEAWSSAPAGTVVYLCAVYDQKPIEGLLGVKIERRLVAEIGYLKQSVESQIPDSLAYISLFTEGRSPLGGWEVDPVYDSNKQVFAPGPSPLADITSKLGVHRGAFAVGAYR